MPEIPPNVSVANDGLLARLSGGWIRRKHHYLDRYCGITASGMKNRFRSRVFIDVMAGPGICKIKETGEELHGSPFLPSSTTLQNSCLSNQIQMQRLL
jgi:hypothetical protein